MTSEGSRIAAPGQGLGRVGSQQGLPDAPAGFRITSVNIGPRVEVEIFGRRVLTAFEKHSVGQAAYLDRHGVLGDGHYGREGQEGLDHAVQICCADNHAFWSGRLDKVLEPGAFGEAITYDGPGEQILRIGDVLSVGPARVQVTSPRLPCAKLAHFLQQDRSFVPQYHATLRTGIYVRVIEPGRIAVGDAMWRESSDPSLPHVAEAAAALLDRDPDPRWLRSLADDPRLSIMLRTMYAKKASAVEARQAGPA